MPASASAGPSPHRTGDRSASTAANTAAGPAAHAAGESVGDGIDGRSSRWDTHRAHRREELLDAAIAAINTHGADVGMEQIAAAAGTSKPVVYRYFDDKDALYRAVGARVVARVVDAVAGVDRDADPRALIRACIDAYLALLDDNPQLFRFVTVHRVFTGPRSADPSARARPAGARPSSDTHGAVSDLLTALLGERMREGGLDPAAAAPWGDAIVGFIRSASLWWLDHPDAMTRPQLTEYLTALLWGGAAGVYQAQGMPVDGRPAPGVFPPLPR